MRGLVRVAIVALALLLDGAGLAAVCTREEFAGAIDRAGDTLRQLNAESAPRLRAKLRQLKDARHWPDSGFEERAFTLLQDEHIAALDRTANDLLAKLDQLGTVAPAGDPDCAQLQELNATSLELQATVKAKAAYSLGKIDQMLAEPTSPGEAKSEAKSETKGEAKGDTKRDAAAEARTEQGEPKARPPTPRQQGWTTQTMGAPPRELAITQPPLTPPQPGAPEEEGYSIEEIREASAGVFGKLSANLGAVIEHLFKNSGRPTAYVIGSEGGGAFLAGVRYGKGTLYQRAGNATQKIYWHGPSLGTDVGADGSNTLFLIYKMTDPEALYATFTGIDGSAYLVGGVGATLLTNGKVLVAPIRSGVGLRLGANVGYIRFTPHKTWNPF
jgi:hypothetical protein